MRGFTIDQRIILEGLVLKNKAQNQLQHESTMVGIITHETAISC